MDFNSYPSLCATSRFLQNIHSGNVVGHKTPTLQSGEDDAPDLESWVLLYDGPCP